MFLGAIPKELAAQIVGAIDIGKYKDVFICCSGSLRMEQAITQTTPDIRIHSNDVSLYTTLVGELAVGKQRQIRFRNRLEFVESLLVDRPYIERVAAMIVAHDMSRYTGKNEYCRAHYATYERNFQQLIVATVPKIEKLLAGVRISTFSAIDWRIHVKNAIEAGALIVAFPPFWKAGYEKLYAFLDDGIEWEPPTYDLYDPKQLDGVLLEIEAAGHPYAVVSDQVWPHRARKLEYRNGRGKPHYGYWSEGKSTVVLLRNRPAAFGYTPVVPESLTAETPVRIVPADSAQMNHVKDVYLSNKIIHSTGYMNFLVYLGDQLAGGIIYALPKFGGRNSIYVLSDFAIVREGRIAKLIAQIATSRTLIREIERRRLDRITDLYTTAFSDHPASMKYRGAFELIKRTEVDGGYQLQYHSKVREMTPQQIYAEWFAKQSAPQQSGRRGRHDRKQRQHQSEPDPSPANA